MGRSGFLHKSFLSGLSYEPTSCQNHLLKKVADFVSSDDSDILVVNGYAGTGKTTAISAVISVMKEFGTKCILLAPTGRAAKVLSSYSGQPAFTIHKHIYRQKSVGGDGFGQFTLSPNKDKEALFVVDEVSLIGIEAGQQQSTTSQEKSIHLQGQKPRLHTHARRLTFPNQVPDSSSIFLPVNIHRD